MKAKSLMILGTASGVGKSVIAAAFCRLFSDLGYKVAPFKAQNMSNNSFVTDEGGEIGRAQAVQAECARVKPSIHMNPILLKPAADNHSQVVIHGKATGHFNARSYYAQKPVVARAIEESYEKLAADYEIIMIEGAGSPAEINLKENDVVNMHMAKLSGARCLLVGDIDRGGVFASLIGTLELLDPDERDLICGFLINKFRGDRSLLDSGLELLEKRTGKKVWGVLPYDRELWIQEEDALNVERSGGGKAGTGMIDIAVAYLPRLSNFTDFETLAHEPGVSLRYIKRLSDFGNPDLLILPGTKATVADLEYLEKNGFREEIMNYAIRGGRILGICGGYQMMGKTIKDPLELESGRREVKGLGFFEMTTEFEPEKVLRQIQEPVRVNLFGTQIQALINAYEIHMGKTTLHKSYAPFGESGAVHSNGTMAGTYYHGLFDSAEFRSAFLDALAKSLGKNREITSASSIEEIKEKQYQRLKKLLEDYVNLEMVFKALSLTSNPLLS